MKLLQKSGQLFKLMSLGNKAPISLIKGMPLNMVVPFLFSTTKYYTKTHEYIFFNDETKIGIYGLSEYAQKELGDIVYVEVPSVGKTFKKGDSIGAIESVKIAADYYAPCEGEVIQVNETLATAPQLINEKAETDGYLFKLKVKEPSELKDHMSKEKYNEFVKSIVH